MAAFFIVQKIKKLDASLRHLFRFLLADRGPLLEGLSFFSFFLCQTFI
jgi:hypothetical protein